MREGVCGGAGEYDDEVAMNDDVRNHIDVGFWIWDVVIWIQQNRNRKPPRPLFSLEKLKPKKAIN